jgi:hypothetical protein
MKDAKTKRIAAECSQRNSAKNQLFGDIFLGTPSDNIYLLQTESCKKDKKSNASETPECLKNHKKRAKVQKPALSYANPHTPHQLP